MMEGKTAFDNATLELDGDLSGGEVEFKPRPPVTHHNPSDGHTHSHTHTDPMLGQDLSLNASSKSSISSGKTAMIPNKIHNDYTSKPLFSYREGAFESAVETCRGEVVQRETDGNVHAAWLLTEIDHWDNEKERLVILTDSSLLIIKYDFIANCVRDSKRILLHFIDKMQIGDLVYPPKSVMPARNHGGIRLTWDKNQDVGILRNWNPFSRTIPYITLAHHPLVYHEREHETITYNVDDCYESLLQTINQAYRVKRPGEVLHVEEGPVVIESYISLSSMVHNQSHLGFSRERGGVSF